MSRSFMSFTLAAAAQFLLASLCTATPLVYGSLVPTSSWADSRSASTGGGLAGNGDWDGLSVSWKITQTGTAFHYEYTFGGLSRKALSHVILDVSDNCGSHGGECVYNADYNVTGTPSYYYETFGASPGNPGFPEGAAIFGVKFDEMPDNVTVISFDSLRAPMWGDFYAKDGRATGTTTMNYGYNQGLESHATYNGSQYYLAVPDTVGEDTAAPEPGTWTLLVCGGLMFALGAWRRSKRRS
jgi:hypothetical protein